MTTAAKTAFCMAEIRLGDEVLYVDGNGKITASNGTLDNPKPNAFSIRNIDDCPGSTSLCRASCYVAGIRKHASDLYTLYEHNSAMIRKILNAEEKDWIEHGPLEWAEQLGLWIDSNCNEFRWHVSGDVFSAQYARWIAEVCHWSSGAAGRRREDDGPVRHWIYTRSFEFVPYLVEAENLTVNLSVDAENEAAARRCWEEFPNTRPCFMATEKHPEPPSWLPRGSVIFPDYGLRGETTLGKAWYEGLPGMTKSFVCPVDFRGKSEKTRCGPCDRCIKPVTIAPPVGGPRRGK